MQTRATIDDNVLFDSVLCRDFTRRDFIRAWDFIRARDFISDRRTENGGGTPVPPPFPSTRMPLSQIKARDFIRDFVRVRGLRKKHAHKAPEKKQQQESGLIGLLLLFFGR